MNLIELHELLVKILLSVMVLNILIPYLIRNNVIKAIWWSRVGFFTFWAFWAMVAFTGLVIFAFLKAKVSVSIAFMIVTTIILAFLDGFRAIKITKIWRSGSLGLKFNTIVLLIEIVLLIITTIFAITHIHK